jgi:hypothetical protein
MWQISFNSPHTSTVSWQEVDPVKQTGTKHLLQVGNVKLSAHLESIVLCSLENIVQVENMVQGLVGKCSV